MRFVAGAESRGADDIFGYQGGLKLQNVCTELVGMSMEAFGGLGTGEPTGFRT